MPFRLRFGPLFAMMAAPALLATIGASYTAFWFYGASHLKERIAMWAEAQRAEGVSVAYTLDGPSGFPLRLTAALEAVSVESGAGGDAVSFSAPRLTVEGGIFSPRHLSFTLPDGGRIAMARNGRATRLGKTGGDARLDLSFDSAGMLREAALTAQNLAVSGDWRGAALASPLTAGETKAVLVLNPAVPAAAAAGDAAAPPPTARFDLSVRNLRWPDGATRSLGPDLAGFDFAAKLIGPMPKGEAQDALTIWRDAGGRVEVERIALKWGQASFAGYGTLVLDEALQPAVSLVARVQSFVPLVDVLDEAGLIRQSDATLARLVIGRQMPQTGAGNLSLSLRDGIVYAGPLALVRVPPIAWAKEIPKAAAAKRRLTPGGREVMQPGIDIGKDGVVRQR
ncbi:DUF2125 domain-containing protein [Oleispirillum naphthae]|uniref:DUF2125 domain-containing protein n=1 Tax=Oleispirillum naphthae TaxID=2838853 RepID=UPI00308261FC